MPTLVDTKSILGIFYCFGIICSVADFSKGKGDKNKKAIAEAMTKGAKPIS